MVLDLMPYALKRSPEFWLAFIGLFYPELFVFLLLGVCFLL